MCVRRKGKRLESGEQRGSPPDVGPVQIFEPPSPAVVTSPDPLMPDWVYSTVVWKRIQCWELPAALSQSKFADRNKHSSACTLIAVTVAKNICHALEGRLPRLKDKQGPFMLPEWMLTVLCTAMLDGNEAHSIAMAERVKNNKVEDLKDTFTVPQAIAATGGGVHEIDWMICKGPCRLTLGQSIISAIHNPIAQSLPALFFVVIILERAIMIHYDRRSATIAVLDSHSRRRARMGAMISMAPAIFCELFCFHICQDYFREITEETDHMEISCLQILSSDSSSTGSQRSSKSQDSTISVRLFPRHLAKSAANRKKHN